MHYYKTPPLEVVNAWECSQIGATANELPFVVYLTHAELHKMANYERKSVRARGGYYTQTMFSENNTQGNGGSQWKAITKGKGFKLGHQFWEGFLAFTDVITQMWIHIVNDYNLATFVFSALPVAGLTLLKTAHRVFHCNQKTTLVSYESRKNSTQGLA